MKSKVVWKFCLSSTTPPTFEDLALLLEKSKEFPKATLEATCLAETTDEYWVLVEGPVSSDAVQRALGD